jgi:hypothetical protein
MLNDTTRHDAFERTIQEVVAREARLKAQTG